MDAKQVRKLLDEVCADLDRRRADMSALVGRYARPVGLGLALGLSGVAGCGSGSSPGKDLDAAIDLPRSQDVYAATSDLYVQPDGKDAGIEYPSASVDAYGVTVDVADLRPPSPDVYGVADLPGRDVADARVILDSSPDVYGVPIWDALPGVDASAIDGGSVDKPKQDGASMAAEPADGGATD